MRKIYLQITARVVVTVDENVTVEDIVSNLGIESIDEGLTLVEDYSIQDYEVTDSK